MLKITYDVTLSSGNFRIKYCYKVPWLLCFKKARKKEEVDQKKYEDRKLVLMQNL